MSVVNISTGNAGSIRAMIPDYLLAQKVKIWGYMVEKQICGVVVLDQRNGGSSLPWIWVMEEHRKKGYGSALMDKVCQEMLKKGDILSVSYPAEETWSRVMEYMLAVRGFELEMETITSFQVTRQQLQHSMLAVNEKTKKGEQNIIALDQLRAYQIAELKARYDGSDGYLVSRADFYGADQQHSMALVIDGRIEGTVLMHKTADQGCYKLSLFFIAQDKLIWALPLLRKAAAGMLRSSTDFQEIEFTCVNENALRAAEHIFGEGNPTRKLLGHGVLHTKFYHGRD